MFDSDQIAEALAWRHDFHRHPELGFAEHRTAGIIAGLLEGWGWQVHRGLAGTGVVARRGEGRGIGLRADIDALPIEEAGNPPWRSTLPGLMHACGHDGHTAMLLLAARRLADTDLGGRSVTLIFQPAEESEGGGRVMVEEGLFRRFPCEAVFAIHNWPGLPQGSFTARDDRMMAAFAVFDITIRGTGGHAAMPEQSAGVLSAAGRLVSLLQEIPARRLSPLEPGVLSVTQVHGGSAYNICPDEARLAGTARWFDPAAGDRLEAALREVTAGIAAAHGCTAEIRYDRRYPATINTPAEAARARRIAASGGLTVLTPPPSMASEDFAFMLEAQRGAYLWLGAAREGHNPGLHAADFDFNDKILAEGAAFWVRLVEDSLA